MFSNYKNIYKKNKIQFFLKVILDFSIFIFLGTLPIFTYRPGFNKITIVFAIFFGLVLLVYTILYKKILISSFVIILIIFTLYCFIDTILKTRLFDSCKSILTTALMSIAIYEYCVQEKSISFVALNVIISAIILCIFIFIDNYESIISMNFDRISRDFGDQNTIGLIITAGATLVLYEIIKTRNKIKIFSLVFIFIFLFPFILMSGSRGALFSCLLEIFLFLYFKFGKKHKMLFLVLMFALIVLFVLVIQLPLFSELKNRLIGMVVGIFNPTSGSLDMSTYSRLKLFEEGLSLWARNPIFGNGGSSFAILSGQDTWSHSTISDLLCCYGAVGLIVWLFPIGQDILSKKGSNKVFTIMFAVGFLLPALFHSVVYYDKLTMIFYAVAKSEFFLTNKDIDTRWALISFRLNDHKIYFSKKLAFDLYGFRNNI